MGRNTRTSAIVDGVLRAVALGAVVSVSMTAPNAVQALDKIIGRYFLNLDSRARKRQYAKYISYMKRQGLISYGTKDYEHGIGLTKAGKKRIDQSNDKNMSIKIPAKWDKKWRIILFDIPEDQKSNRDNLTKKLKNMRFVQLQRSVWVHPYDCREEIEHICKLYSVSRYVTYIETDHIDNQKKLMLRFPYTIK